MSVPIVAFDESGNTGQNLLDPGQPVFVLASLRAEETEARALVERFASSPCGELHFKELRGSAAGRRALLSVLESPLISKDRVKITVFHKPYMVTTKIVDLLVEPFAHRRGYDLYRRGWNIAMSNVLHATLPAFCGADVTRELLVRFVAMVRKKTPETVESFYAHLTTMYRRADPDTRRTLEPLLGSRELVADVLEAADITALDPAVPAFVRLAALWSADLPFGFEVIHDASKPLEHEREILQAFMSRDEPRVLVGYDRRKFVFPLAANGIAFHDSRGFAQIQLADVVAGATAYVYSRNARGQHDEFSRALAETALADMGVWPLWPSGLVTPEALGTNEGGGINAVDYVADALRRRPRPVV